MSARRSTRGEPLWGNYPPGEEYKASLAAAHDDPA
jgi:hypothetical protein